MIMLMTTWRTIAFCYACQILSDSRKEIFGNTRIAANCQLLKKSTDRNVSGGWIDRELALVGVGSKRACDQDGESQEWGLACRWHGDVTQLSTPQKIGSSVWTSGSVDRQITNDLILER